MDQGMDRITQDVKDIVETRTAIADKLEKLEQRFASSVEETKMIAENLADRTQSVIENTVDSIRKATDPSRVVSHYPWVMVGGAVMAGFALRQVFRNSRSGVMPHYPPGSRGANIMPQSPSNTDSKEGKYPFYPPRSSDDASRPMPSSSATTASLFTYLSPVIAEGLRQVKGDLVAIGTSALRTWIKEAAQSERGSSRNSDSVISGSLASPTPPEGSDTKERGNEMHETESRSHR